MESSSAHYSAQKTPWLFSFFTFPAVANLFDSHVLFPLFLAFLSVALLTWVFASAGIAWKNGRNSQGRVAIPGLKGVPFFGSLFSLSLGLPHRYLASMAKRRHSTELMAFSVGETPVVVSSHPVISREILTSPYFADRPVKQSARSLMFSRAIGFAPNGAYWRLLRRIASSHLFSPRRISAHEAGRQSDCDVMLRNIANEQKQNGCVSLRKHLQFAALNNVMGSVFGKRYDLERDGNEFEQLREMVREGFDLLGSFNWSDYLPWISFFYDPSRIVERCSKLVPRVQQFVKNIIDEHRHNELKKTSDKGDFVDVLLSLDGDEKLQEDDMIAVLWEMIFRGTDTTALLTEWVMAELVINSDVQAKLQDELNTLVGDRSITDADVARLPYLQAVVKEALRVHPPGPLLSWARLSTSDVQLSNGMLIPANTTAMVNMWAITHDADVWDDPHVFKPERFLQSDVDIRGGDLRLAPFGAGRRVCPGKNLGLAMVTLWVAKLVSRFKWVQATANPVDLSEVLKLSSEMKNPLCAVAEEKKIRV